MVNTTSSTEMARAEVDASRLNRQRADIAPATINVDASSTISWPTPNPGGGTGILPTIPPIALARPPPSALLVSHGSHSLTASTAAHSTTSQPGRRRAMRSDYPVRPVVHVNA